MISVENTIPKKVEAEKYWNQKEYKKASDCYYEAASIAKRDFHNDYLANCFLLEHYIALMSGSQSMEISTFKNAILTITKLIDLRIDDRVEYKLLPYKLYFQTLIYGAEHNVEKLHLIQQTLTHHSLKYKLSTFQAYTLIVAESYLTYFENLNEHSAEAPLKKLSARIINIIDNSVFDQPLENLLKGFALDILDYSEKKKI